MQNVSKQYRDSMRSIGRNRGYIKISIGIVNSQAQSAMKIDENTIEKYSDAQNCFNGAYVENVYATCEQNFTSVNGSMYFLPTENNYSLYGNGIVSKELCGAIDISFGDNTYYIKGLTIDFGESYPTDFSIEGSNESYTYNENNTRYFTTEDVFNNTNKISIKAYSMKNGKCRLRINTIVCGIANTFTNADVQSFETTEFVSSVSETLPSNDTKIVIYNYDQYYNPDNPNSALSYMETGQEVKVSFGYDVDGKGNIEWLPPTTTFLSSWDADDTTATFTSVDRFCSIDSVYYKGVYKPNGISLYDLAIDVLTDMGLDDSEYYIDVWLKNVIVKNPIPVVKHTEALQIIANAGRCSISQDRQGRIHLQSVFVPNKVATSDNQTTYSNVANIINTDEKDLYAELSYDLTKLNDNSMYFMPDNSEYLNVGYVSKSISKEDGTFDVNPKITVVFESGYVPFGLSINFRNVPQTRFNIITYNNDEMVETFDIRNSDLIYTFNGRFNVFDKMEIEFIRNEGNSRVFVDNILFGDATDYTLTRQYDMTNTPKAKKEDRIRKIVVGIKRYINNDTTKQLFNETIRVVGTSIEKIVYFNNASYNLQATSSNATVTILESSNFYAKVRIVTTTENTDVTYTINGCEYDISEQQYEKVHDSIGIDKTWNNPLISDEEHATDVESWIADYFLGNVSYEIEWRGDPCIDANDLFHFETKNGDISRIRAFQTSLSFNGAWKGKLKARKVVQ